jgi:hypothetical protein
MKTIARLLANLLLVALSLAIGALAIELALDLRLIPAKPFTPQGYVDVKEMARRAAIARGDPADTRKVSQVIAERRAAGVRAFPTISPRFLARDPKGSPVMLDGAPVLPLGITANSETYYCNESGQWAALGTDRFGFRNPDGVWDALPADLLVVGDSFTFGSCLPIGQSIVGNLRGGGRKVVNLGEGGNGPLAELAGVREYAASVRPAAVLWIFFPNDLDDLKWEADTAILKKYLSPDFSQNLAALGTRLSAPVDAIVEKYYEGIVAAERVSVPRDPFWKFPAIRSTYAYLGAHRKQAEHVMDVRPFIDVIRQADADAKKAGARVIFAYLPDCEDNTYGQREWKPTLFAALARAGITAIDTEEVIKPESFFHCPGSHYTPAGAKAVAERIAAQLPPARAR